jgi:hypothetical protein
MRDYYKSYVNNFNRVRLVELIDHHQCDLRTASFRASLIINPVTGLSYGTENALGSGDLAPAA